MNVIVIMLDSLRKDHLGCYGNSWIETPNIDRFAAESIIFENASYPKEFTEPPIPKPLSRAARAFIALAVLTILACGGCDTSVKVSPAARKPTPIIWTLKAPKGRQHGLFTIDALRDESCKHCLIGGLDAGTRLSPIDGTCYIAEWDPHYVYCWVQVLNGPLAGQRGWVNQKFIRK